MRFVDHIGFVIVVQGQFRAAWRNSEGQQSWSDVRVISSGIFVSSCWCLYFSSTVMFSVFFYQDAKTCMCRFFYRSLACTESGNVCVIEYEMC